MTAYMHPASRVYFDSVQRVACVGGCLLAASVERGGAVRLGGPQGPLLQPLSFGERRRAVRAALDTPDPIPALCAALLSLATVEAGTTPGDLSPDFPWEQVLQVLALYLAGARGDRKAPGGFSAQALALGASAGWDLAQIEQAEATWVDQLAAELLSQPGEQRPEMEAGRTRILFAPSVKTELEALRLELAEELLARGEASGQMETRVAAPLGSLRGPPGPLTSDVTRGQMSAVAIEGQPPPSFAPPAGRPASPAAATGTPSPAGAQPGERLRQFAARPGREPGPGSVVPPVPPAAASGEHTPASRVPMARLQEFIARPGRGPGPGSVDPPVPSAGPSAARSPANGKTGDHLPQFGARPGREPSRRGEERPLPPVATATRSTEAARQTDSLLSALSPAQPAPSASLRQAAPEEAEPGFGTAEAHRSGTLGLAGVAAGQPPPARGSRGAAYVLPPAAQPVSLAVQPVAGWPLGSACPPEVTAGPSHPPPATPAPGGPAAAQPASADLYDLSSLDEVAEALAALLSEEADLRGLDP